MHPIQCNLHAFAFTLSSQLTNHGELQEAMISLAGVLVFLWMLVWVCKSVCSCACRLLHVKHYSHGTATSTICTIYLRIRLTLQP